MGTRFDRDPHTQGAREEHRLGLLEFSLLGKPWVHKRAAESERLFLDILVRPIIRIFFWIYSDKNCARQ